MTVGKFLGRVATVVGMFFLYSIAEAVAMIPGLMKGQQPWWLVGGVFLVTFGALIYFCYTVYQYFLRHESPQVYGNHRFDRKTLRFLLIMIGVLVLVQIINYIVVDTGITPEAANQTDLMELMQKVGAPMALIAVLGAPPVEEFIFRGLLMHCFPHQETVKWRIISGTVSTLVFATAHTLPTDFLNWLMYAGMGATFTATYAYTKDIRYSMGLHFLNNFVATFLP